jgi:probable rRNA maturation factor
MTLDIDIAVESPDWSVLAELGALVRRSIDTAVETIALEGSEGAELSVLFCDDAMIRQLNKDWRGKDKATNVLSFPAMQSEGVEGPRLLGDIAIAFETVRREAEADDKPLADHVAHLLVHGFLHLLDHDHEDAAEAEAMEQLETRILARLGIADPYAGSDPVEATLQ